MYKNYLKVAIRNLLKNKTFSVINILGLALGLTVSILVFLFVKSEYSYEKHINDYEQIYRTSVHGFMNNQEFNNPASPSPLAHSLRTDFPEVISATRFRPIRQEIMMRHEQNTIYNKNVYYVDSAFFNVFSYEFIYGDAKNALNDENTIVISEEMAQKYFGDANPVGKILNYDNRQDMLITGVVKQQEGKSHFTINAFVASNDVRNFWMSNNFYTYVKLKENLNIERFKKKLNDYMYIKIEPDIKQVMNMTPAEYMAIGNSYSYGLTSIKDIHLRSRMNWEIEENGNIMYVYIFIAIAFLVLLIAGINFMNLSTARSSKRAKEVGIRKVSGATRPMLIGQFLLESIIQSFIALLVAFVIVEFFIPIFNNIMQTDIKLINSHFQQTILFAVIITLVYGIFSGSYPAFFLSSFQPINVLKGDISKSKGGALFRKTLVVVQFTASVVLIISMMVIFMQISYMQNKELGFKSEQVIVVPLQTDEVADNFRTLKQQFLQNPKVLSMSRSDYLPGDSPNQNMYKMEGDETNIPIWNMSVDYDFFQTLNIELSEGRLFNSELDHDSSFTVIINEQTAKMYNLDNPIGKRIDVQLGNPDPNKRYATIVGVVKNFHIENFENEIRPMIFNINNYTWFASVKISPDNVQETIAFVEDTWNRMEPTHPFTYMFLDEKFEAFFQQQKSFGKIFLYLTVLAIIISCMGLFALASYTAEQKIKEIGIRKVLGASIAQLMSLLSKEFVKLVLIANVIAWPIAFILARNWLSDFSYQINMPILPFIAATIGAIIIAIATVSYQAYQAALSDPIKALKYE